MTPENFTYWLQGLFELQPDLKTLDEQQIKMIRDHLGYVFDHMDQNRPKKEPTYCASTLTFPVRPSPPDHTIQSIVDTTKLTIC